MVKAAAIAELFGGRQSDTVTVLKRVRFLSSILHDNPPRKQIGNALIIKRMMRMIMIMMKMMIV